VGAASVYGVYLTHTRAVWLSFALVVVIGAAAGRGFRAGFVLTGAVTVGAVVLTWSTFTSADRSAGGVGSVDEVQDRLNTIATSIWAFQQEPVTGWGIGRFIAVNTYHHKQWSPLVPWDRGLGIPSHLDSLGILVELGLVGLISWLVAFALIYAQLVAATRRLSARGVHGRALGLTALLCLIALSTTGLTVDLRFFDYPNIIVMLLVGATIGFARAQAGSAAALEPRTVALAPSMPSGAVRP
jgi:O-antigen ligase